MDGGGAQGRHGWVVLCYYFLGALLGLFVTTFSVIFLVNTLIFAAGGGGEVVGGAALTAVVGVVVLYTHLTQGLKLSSSQAQSEQAAGDTSTASQSTPPAQVAARATPLWPGAVYFRVAALVGLIVAVTGAIGLADALTSAIFGTDLPRGFTTFDEFAPPFVENNTKELVNWLLVTAVGLGIMWWHLAAARKQEL